MRDKSLKNIVIVNFCKQWIKAKSAFTCEWVWMCKMKILTLFSPKTAILKETVEEGKGVDSSSLKLQVSPWIRIPSKSWKDSIIFPDSILYHRTCDPVPVLNSQKKQCYKYTELRL